MKDSFTFYGRSVRDDVVETLNAWATSARPSHKIRVRRPGRNNNNNSGTGQMNDHDEIDDLHDPFRGLLCAIPLSLLLWALIALLVAWCRGCI